MNTEYKFDTDAIDFSSESFSSKFWQIKQLAEDQLFQDRDWWELYETIYSILDSSHRSRNDFFESDLARDITPKNKWENTYDKVAREGNLSEEALLERQQKIFAMLDSIDFPRAEFVELEALNYQSYKSHKDDFDKAVSAYNAEKREKEDREREEEEHIQREIDLIRKKRQDRIKKCEDLLREFDKTNEVIGLKRKELDQAIIRCGFGIFINILIIGFGVLSSDWFMSIISLICFFIIIFLVCIIQKYSDQIPDYLDKTEEIIGTERLLRELRHEAWFSRSVEIGNRRYYF